MSIKTKYGTANLHSDGYYVITSRKEGNHQKKLHRLVFEDYHNCKLDENDVIHHVDFDKTNNHATNLICMSKKAHTLLHNKDEDRLHEWAIKQSKTKSNKTNYFRVSKQKTPGCKQGFSWRYQYTDENGKRRAIWSVDIKKLEKKVKAKGLEWRELA